MAAYTVIVKEFGDDGQTVHRDFNVEADAFRYNSLNEHETFVEFVDEHGRVVDIVDTGPLYRISADD